MKTCTTNLKEYLPDQYHSITHETIAEMLANEGYINEIHIIQISKCHRFVSLCFDTRETLLPFINTGTFNTSEYLNYLPTGLL